MSCTVVIDWKVVVAVGVVAVCIIAVWKMDAADAKERSIHVVDACKGYAVAVTGEC